MAKTFFFNEHRMAGYGIFNFVYFIRKIDPVFHISCFICENRGEHRMAGYGIYNFLYFIRKIDPVFLIFFFHM